MDKSENINLSVIIVNYNVKYFIQQCLHSVEKAINNINTEVFVVDNNSVDGSCQMIEQKYPWVKLIKNKKNIGFSKANNQAIKISKGKYILLLNPDTIVEEDTFNKVCKFMDSHPDAGGLGVKMIDGKGKFLPESKRGLPTPAAAFYKIFGISKIFPKSKTFNKYHLGYLDKEQIHKIDVLSGAFMLMRKSVLDKIGYLDETFFMYGEDIDLSYRIIKAGYANYYFPQTTIIHYKGESTKKGSINYVMIFYKAMIIFANKHFSQKNAKLFSFFINIAIYFRAILSILSRFLKNIFLPIIDAGLIFSTFLIIKPFWEHYKFHEQGIYPEQFLKLIVPAYIIIWITSMFFSGAYEKPVKITQIVKGFFIGSIGVLLFYSLLSESLRFSRALIFIGATISILLIILLRIILHFTKIKSFKLKQLTKKNILIVGSKSESERIKNIINNMQILAKITGVVSSNNKTNDNYYLGNLSQLKEIARIYKVNEIIYCAKDISSQQIINSMLLLSSEIDYKIASPDSLAIIGSNSLNSQGTLYTININSISKESSKRNKRFIDFVMSIILILLLPVLIIFKKNRLTFIKNLFLVLIGSLSFVGYCKKVDINYDKIPKIKDGILSLVDLHKNNNFSPDEIKQLNLIYAKDYKVITDIKIILKNILNL